MSARYFFEESEDRTVMLPQGRRLSEPAAGLRDGPFLLDGPAAAGLNEQMPDAYREDHPGSGPWEFERADEAAASGDLQPRETEAFEGPQDRESQENESVRDTPVWREGESSAVGDLPATTSAKRASLTADEITMIFGGEAAIAALHWLLASKERQQAVLAALSSRGGRRSVRVSGRIMPLSSYLRLLSRLCREAAEQTGETGETGESWQMPYQHEDEHALCPQCAGATSGHDLASGQSEADMEVLQAELDPVLARGEVYEEEVPKETSAQQKCKQDWLKRFASLPEPLRQALSQKDFNNAIVIAIHHGWRDLDKLTDLIFLAEKGDTRGYCRLTGSKADAADVEFWRQKKGIVRSYMAHPSPPLAQHGGVQCRKVEVRQDVARSERAKLDLTGRYEYREYVKVFNSEVTQYVVNINHAGKHIEGIMTRVLRPGEDERSRTQYRIYGDLQSDGSYLVFSTTKPADFWGYLRPDAKGRLFWVNAGSEDERWESEQPLTKYSDDPTLMESAFSPQAFSPTGLVHRQEWFPLSVMQKNHLAASLSADRIAPYLQRCFSTAQGFKYAEKEAVGRECWKLWSYIEQVFTDPNKGVHQVDRTLAIHYARTLLAANSWTFTSPGGQPITLSQLDWIQDMLDRVFEAGGGTPNLRNGVHSYLWLRPNDPNVMRHTYRISASLRGAAFIGGYFRGDITIKNLDGKDWKEETFKIVLKGFQVVPGFSVDFEGEAQSANPWKPADFPGSLDLLGASAGVKAPGIKATAKAAVMTIFGSGDRTPLIVTSQDAELGVNLSKKWGIEKPDLNGRWGEIRPKQLPDLEGGKIRVSTDHAGVYGLESDAHFCLGSALLTEDARQALRVVCATELAAFMSAQSRLSIFGFADTVGYQNATPEEANERNLKLSLFRAQNTLQAIRDILGDRFRIPEKNLIVTGEGQKAAEKAGLVLGQPDPRYRRVDVVLNTMLLISLRV